MVSLCMLTIANPFGSRYLGLSGSKMGGKVATRIRVAARRKAVVCQPSQWDLISDSGFFCSTDCDL